MNNSSMTMLDFSVGASVMVFAIYNIVHICLIFKGRLLNVEYEQAKMISADHSILQNPEAAKTFREGNSTMITTDLAFAALAFAGFIAAVAMLSNGKNKKALSAALTISSISACICLCLSARFASSATQFTVAQVPLDDAQRYMKGLLVKAFVTRKIGYRLFFFSFALSTGWVPAIGGLLMFEAVVVLVLIYVISDARSPAAVSQDTDQDTFSLGPLPRENPTRLPNTGTAVSVTRYLHRYELDGSLSSVHTIQVWSLINIHDNLGTP